MILVDSSIWISYFDRGTSPLADRIDAMITSGLTLAATPAILQEVLQGSRSESHFQTLRSHFAAVHLLRPKHSADTYAEAARIYARCRWAGVTPRSAADCLIVRIAVEHGVPLFHDDRDFETIARFVPALRLV